MSFRIFDSLLSGFRSSKKRIPFASCVATSECFHIVQSNWDLDGGHPGDIAASFQRDTPCVNLGKAILESFDRMKFERRNVPIDEHWAAFDQIATRIGLADKDELEESTVILDVSGGRRSRGELVDQYIHIVPIMSLSEEESATVEVICEARPNLVGRFVKRTVALAEDSAAFRRQVQLEEARRQAIEDARREFFRAPSREKECMKPGFAVGQRVKYELSEEQGVVLAVDPDFHSGQGRVDVRLDNGEIIVGPMIKSFLQSLDFEGG